MLEQQCFKYITSLRKNSRIKPNHIAVMSYLIELSKDDNWNPKVRTSLRGISRKINISVPPVRNTIEELEIDLGMIRSETDNKGSTIEIQFILDLLETKGLKKYAKKDMSRVLENHCGSDESGMRVGVFPGGGDGESGQNSDKDSFTQAQNSDKDSYTQAPAEALRLMDSMVLVYKNITHKKGSDKDSLPQKSACGILSAHFKIPRKSMGLFNLARLDEEEMHKRNVLLARIGINKKPKNLLLLLEALNRVFFDGKLMKAFEQNVEKIKEKDSLLIYTENGLEVTDKIYQYIPTKYHNLKESLFVSFLAGKEVGGVIDVNIAEALKEWILYISEVDGKDFNPSSVTRMFDGSGVFSKTKKPIRSIFKSIEKGYRSIVPFENIDNYGGKENNDRDDDTISYEDWGYSYED